jgi:hypothetical protein
LEFGAWDLPACRLGREFIFEQMHRISIEYEDILRYHFKLLSISCRFVLKLKICGKTKETPGAAFSE